MQWCRPEFPPPITMLPDPQTAARGSVRSLDEQPRRHHHHGHHHRRKAWSETLSDWISEQVARHRPLLLALFFAAILLVIMLWLFSLAENQVISQYAGG